MRLVFILYLVEMATINISHHDDLDDIVYQISGYFEYWANNESADSLDDLYALGMPIRPADHYLWNLDNKLGRRNFRFTMQEIKELEQNNVILQGSAYPLVLKHSMTNLLSKFSIITATNSRAKNLAVRNVYETRTGLGAQPGAGPANLIRAYAGIKVPRGAEGGSRKKNRKAKKTRKVKKSRYNK